MPNPASLNVTDLASHGAVAPPAAQTIDTNGTVACPNAASETERMLIELVNAAVNAITVTVKAGANPPSQTVRDLAINVPATSTRILSSLESARFIKADGGMDLAFLAAVGAPNLNVRIYRLPKRV